MAHQFDEKVILLRNLINRIEQNDRNGHLSLKGNITRGEMEAITEAHTALKNYNSGVLVPKQ